MQGNSKATLLKVGHLLCFYFSGYLHGHVSYLSDDCQACLLLLTVDRDAFFILSEAKQKISEVRFHSGTQGFSCYTDNDKSCCYYYYFFLKTNKFAGCHLPLSQRELANKTLKVLAR
jgi:hypothetical protein